MSKRFNPLDERESNVNFTPPAKRRRLDLTSDHSDPESDAEMPEFHFEPRVAQNGISKIEQELLELMENFTIEKSAKDPEPGRHFKLKEEKHFAPIKEEGHLSSRSKSV